jgi:glycosyltransferase involved in cell wall biosynthesis
MNVVWVTVREPSPPPRGAGDELELLLLESVARHNSVHVISSSPLDGATVHLASMLVTCEQVTWHPTSPSRFRVRGLLRLIADDSSAGFFRQGDRTKALAAALVAYEARHGLADIVCVASSEIAPVLADLRSARVLLLFDEYTRVIEREMAHATWLGRRWYWRWQLYKLRRWERSHFSKARSIACISGADAESVRATLGPFLSRQLDVRVLDIPIAPGFFESPDVRRSMNIVTFVGSLGHPPNRDAALWLINDIWPIVRSARPDARCRIVGLGPPGPVADAAARQGVELQIDVTDIRRAYWEAAVFVAPIRHGAGLKHKVLHAIACGAPLVATSAAVEGIPLRANRDYVLADDAWALSQAIVEALDHPLKAQSRARNASLLAGRYHPREVGQALQEWWRDVLHGGPAT